MKYLNKITYYIGLNLLTLGLLPAPALAQCDSTTELCNPLRADDLQGFLLELVDAILILSIPVIVFFIIFAGFTFVTSGGDTSKIEKAKKMAIYTIIGAAVILGASLIGDILEGTFDSVQEFE